MNDPKQIQHVVSVYVVSVYVVSVMWLVFI